MVEIVLDYGKEEENVVFTGISSSDNISTFVLPEFDWDKFLQSLWVIHDLIYEGLAYAPDGELGITVTSPSNRSLRYLVKRVE